MAHSLSETNMRLDKSIA